jgi:hypothetical protein
MDSARHVCGVCGEFDKGLQPVGSKWTEVERSALGGCASCNLLRAGVNTLFPELAGQLEDAKLTVFPFSDLSARLEVGNILEVMEFFTLAGKYI